MSSKVGISRGSNRQDNILAALKPLADDLREKIARKRRVVIKPNLGFIKHNLANTQAEAVEAVLMFLRQFYSKKIIIAESTTVGETDRAYFEYDYEDLADKYNVELRDLNDDDFVDFKIYDGRLSPKSEIGLAKTLAKSDFIISVCPMKTHDSVIVTLGIKNVAVGAIRRKDRSKLHAGPKAINLSIAKIAKKVWPSLSVLDGFWGMEGNGPVEGEKVEFKTAIASLDAMAADVMGTILMGYNPQEIGYLSELANQKMGTADPLKMIIMGGNWRTMVRKFKPHESYQQQLKWQT
ncbi:MAG TPA: DUF362 domain-containing protein [Patescibacteria group bacterium]|nr:DUF362 domain-containing protein [Patescibacteria group bacterium]